MKIFNGILICIWISILAASAYSLDSLEGTSSQAGISLKSTPNVFIPSSASIVNTLVIETGGSIGNTVVRALDSLGAEYDFMHTEDFTSIDFSPYSIIILGMDGGLVDSTSIEAVANAAALGKKLIILGGTNHHPYYVGVQNYLLQHNGVEDWFQSATPHLTVTAPGHPLTVDLPSPYNYVNPGAAQYMLRITDPAATEVAVNGDGFPALVSKSIGNGVLIYSITSPWDAHYLNEPDYAVLYTIVRNALDLEIPQPPRNLIAFSGDGYVNLWWQVPFIPPTISELAYDDGGDEGNLSIGNTTEGNLAVRFTPNVYPSTIMAIKVHFATSTTGMSSIDWTIWDGDSNGLGNSLATGNQVINRGVFDTVDVASAGVQIASGDFFISYFEPNGQTMNLSWDTTQPSANRSWVNAPLIGFPWQTLVQTGIAGFDNNLMIRAIVLEGAGPNARLVELSPAGESRSSQVITKGRSIPVSQEEQAGPSFQNYYLDGTPPSPAIAHGYTNPSTSRSLSEFKNPASPDYGIGDLDGYNIYRSTDGISFSNIDFVNTLNYTDNNVVNGNAYWYYVTAVYTEGESSPSDTVKATPNVPPPAGTLFGSDPQTGSLITIDPNNGAGSMVGPTFAGLTEIEFRKDGLLYASTGGGTSAILTINVFTGEPTLLGFHDYGAVNGLEFSPGGTLYGTFITGPGDSSQLVIVDPYDASLTYIGYTGFNNIGGLAFSPDGSTLYGVTAGPDSIGNLVTIDTLTGMATLVGPVGFDRLGALEFGPNGILYAGTGSSVADSGSVITINPATGAGTLVGSTGFPSISGLSFYPAPFVSIDNDITEGMPQQFELYQNYPNPFNPTTTIKYQLPVAAKVKITIYNLLGQKVITLVDELKQAGVFKANWDGLNKSGDRVASGIYIYRIQTDGFVSSRKMVLLK